MIRLLVVPCTFYPEQNWLATKWFVANLVQSLSEYDDETQADAHRRGLFLYLITSFMRKHNQERPTSYVGFAHDVESRLRQHNGLMPKAGPKTTRNASRPWRITMIVGPYKRHSRDLRALWRKRSRGVPSRIRFGKELAMDTGKSLIDFSAKGEQEAEEEEVVPYQETERPKKRRKTGK